MAKLYFQLDEPARINGGATMKPGNYYIENMDGFTCANDVFKVAISEKHKDKISSMWLQYNNKEVVDLKNSHSEILEDLGHLSEFAQAKLTANAWGKPVVLTQNYPMGSARFLGINKDGSIR